MAWSNQPAGNVVYTLMCRYMQSAAFPGHEKNARQQRLAAAKAKRQVWCCRLLHTCWGRDRVQRASQAVLEAVPAIPACSSHDCMCSHLSKCAVLRQCSLQAAHLGSEGPFLRQHQAAAAQSMR